MSETQDLIDHEIIEERITPQLITCPGEHFFERLDGTAVKCRKCPLGYYLSPGMELKEGHLYREGQVVI